MKQAPTASIIKTHVALCDWLGVPGALLDVAGRLHAATPLTYRMMEAGDLIRIWHGRLQVVSPQGQASFSEALKDVARTARTGIAQCVRHSVMFDGEGGGHLNKLSLAQGVDPDEADDPLLLVTLRPLRATACPAQSANEANLMQAFDLTANQAAVAKALVCGQSVRQIAEERWAPIEVVRRQMTSLYLKVGGGGPRARAEEPLRANL